MYRRLMFGKLGDKVLLIETQFGELDFVNGYFLMVPELESYGTIFVIIRYVNSIH